MREINDPFYFVKNIEDIYEQTEKLLNIKLDDSYMKDKSKHYYYKDSPELFLLDAIMLYIYKYSNSNSHNIESVFKFLDLLIPSDIYSTADILNKSMLEKMFENIKKIDPNSSAIYYFENFLEMSKEYKIENKIGIIKNRKIEYAVKLKTKLKQYSFKKKKNTNFGNLFINTSDIDEYIKDLNNYENLSSSLRSYADGKIPIPTALQIKCGIHNCAEVKKYLLVRAIKEDKENDIRSKRCVKCYAIESENNYFITGNNQHICKYCGSNKWDLIDDIEQELKENGFDDFFTIVINK